MSEYDWAGYLEEGSYSVNNTDGWVEPENEDFIPEQNFVHEEIPEVQEPGYEEEPSRAWDIHYTPSWFVEEQTNRKNPDYQADTGWTNEQVDAFANYVKGWQEQKPNDWRYGDPGWKTADAFYQDVIKPKEAEYQQAQRDAQIQAQIEQAQKEQPQIPQTTELAIPGTGNQAPMRTQQEIDDIINNSIYGKMLNIDKSEANFENLSRSEKGIFAWTPSTNGTDVKNAPKSASLTQNIIGAAMSGTGMGAIAKLATGLAGGPAGLVGAGVWFGTSLYSYLRSQGVIENNKATDIADKVIAFTDIGDDIGAGLQGRVAYAFEKIGGDDLTDTSKLGENLGLIAKNIGSFVHYLVAEGPETEYPSQVVSIVNKLVPDIGANAWGIEGSGVSRFARSAISYLVDKPEDKIWLEKGQTTRANSGLPGVYDIPEEMLGTDAYLYWLDFGKYLYDHGVTNTAQLEYEINRRVADVYGDIANFSQYIEHEMGDLGNSIEAIQPRGMNVYGRVTNDTALQTASSANIQPVVNDAIGSIPIVGQVAQFLGLKTSGGVDQVLDSWRNEVLSSNPDTLTARDKRIAGLNPDGTLKELNVQQDPNSVKNPFGPNWERFKQQFQTTNEYRATMAGDSIFNFINVAMDDAIRQRPGEDPQASVDRVRNFIDQLENPELIQEHTPLYNISHSVLFNSVKEELSMAIRSRRAEIDAIIADYAKLNNNRAVLNTLAQALGLSPAEVMNKYENEKTTLTQMIINKADQNGGKIPGIDIDVESRAFGDRVISMIAPFAGDDAKAYDPRLVMTQITSKIGDGVTETLVNKYGIQQEGWVYRFGDTIKKMQNLWLLGLSPSYLANNVTNNIVTRTALGFGGFLSNKAIQKWNDRFGFTPERFAESTVGTALDSSKNRDSMTNAEKLRAAIREKRKEGNKFFDKVDKQSDWISQHAGFFGKLSGKVEELETKQIMTAASMTYMARTWKPGVNFKRMPIELENAIRAENPDMVDAIYSAISAGVNTDEIEKAIFGTYVVPSAHDALIQAVKNLNMGDAEEVVIDLFAKGGFLAEMNEALKGKMGADIDKVIDDIGERIKAVLQIRLASDIAARAEQVANNVANLSYAEAVKLAQDVSTDMGNVWLNSQMLNSQLFSRRITEGLKSSEFRALYLAQQQILNERWESVYNTSLQNFKGVVKGLGMGDENRTAFIDAMGQKNSLWVNFYKTKQPQLFQPYLNALTWRTDDTFAKWDSRVKKAWSTYTKAISAEYETTVNKEAKLQQQMDNAFVKGLKEAVSDEAKTRVDSVIAPQLEALRNKRQEIINLNRSIRNDTNKTSYLVEKDLKWKENEARLAELKQEYTQMQAQMYDDILAMGPLTSKPAETNSGDVNHEAQIRADVMERQADDMQKTAENFSETMTDEVAETEAVPDLQSTTPEGWADDTYRENIREAAKADGATKEQADVYVKFSDDALQQLPETVQQTIKSLLSKDTPVNEIYNRAELQIADYVSSQIRKIYEKAAERGVEFTSEELHAFTNYVYSYLGISHDDYIGADADNFINKLSREEYNQIDEWMFNKAPEMREAIDKYFNFESKYFMGRNNLTEIALRAGASKKVADAFSRYINLIADKWEKNNAGKDFFTDAPGIGNLRIEFGGNYDGLAGEYNPFARVINIYRGADILTLIHELGHGFQWTLNEQQQKELAKYFGLKYEEYSRINNLWLTDPSSISDDDKAKYIDMTEVFARGFTDYLANNESAPSSTMAQIFSAFRRFVERIFPDIKLFIYEHLFYDHDSYLHNKGVSGDLVQNGNIFMSTERNGVTLQQIFDSMVDMDSQETQTQTATVQATPEQVQNALTNGGLVPFEQADIANIPKAETKDAQVRKIAQYLLNAELNDQDYGKPRRKGGALLTDVARPHFTLNDYIAYIQNSINEDDAPVLSDETRARLFVNTEIYDPDGSIRQEIQKLRQNLRYKGNVPLNGTFVAQTYSFEHGAYNIVGAVFHDGKLVAYVPDTIPTKTIDIRDGRTAQYIGQSVEHPDQWMYILDGQVYEQNQRQDVQHNPYEAQMPKDSMGAIDPMAQAESEVTYEKILPILEEFKQIYKQNVADAFSNKKFSSLKAETQDLIRGYIENDVRSDLMNTKFKAGKFAETMRDAALLNYNKRYGFDNWLTLLAPYQFWQTRSMWNWIQRMGSKGGKLWRRYARLKELERRNMKEIMPSRTTGKLGWYVPGLPDWMGSLLFMSPTQFGVVGNFIEPIEEMFSDNNALLATAQRFLEDAFRDSKISYQQYLEALDPAKRENSAAWQEAFAKAQEEGYTEKDFGSLWQQYFGMALPLSIGKAVLTGNAQDWNQFPMTRTGTAWRAIFGDNAIGKGGQALLSAPERIIRKAVVEATGNNDFQYKEFGNWGDYYIRQQVWDMVVEGRIDPQQAIQAVIEKDGNNIWDEAGERQRQEILQKTQVLSGIAPVKQMADDIINGRTEKLGEDFGYLLSGVISIITPTTVVREAEQTWRKEANELSNLYAANNKEGQQKFYDEHPNYSMYKNLRYEDDPEQSLRQYLYKAITNVYFDLSKEEKLELNMTLGGDSDAFYRDVISKDTRAIETMDINRLWAYAQAMNGATPYLATDKLREVGVTNPPQYNQAVIPQNEKNAHKVYLEARERLYPGMADVNSAYWKLAPEDRKIFKQYNPGLDEYQKWDSQYKVDHPEIKSYNKRQTSYYNLIQAEEACANFDTLTMQALTLAAHTGKKIDPIYDYYIERAQREVGNTDTLDNFKKILTDYILGR